MSATMPGRPRTGGPTGYTQREPLSGLHSGAMRARPVSPCSASLWAGLRLAADAGPAENLAADELAAEDVDADELSALASTAHATPAASAAAAASASATGRPILRRFLSVWLIAGAQYRPTPADPCASHPAPVMPGPCPACDSRPDARSGDRLGPVRARHRRRRGDRIARPVPGSGRKDPVPLGAARLVQPLGERRRKVDPDASHRRRAGGRPERSRGRPG